VSASITRNRNMVVALILIVKGLTIQRDMIGVQPSPIENLIFTLVAQSYIIIVLDLKLKLQKIDKN
jgi:hypothetical protein